MKLCIIKMYDTFPPVAQLDNATDSDSGEREFKSLRADQQKAHAEISMSFFVMLPLPIQRENAGVEIGCERDPYNIRDLQISGGLADTTEIDRHRDDQYQQQNDPDQRE